jgi:hypothetical protein
MLIYLTETAAIEAHPTCRVGPQVCVECLLRIAFHRKEARLYKGRYGRTGRRISKGLHVTTRFMGPYGALQPIRWIEIPVGNLLQRDGVKKLECFIGSFVEHAEEGEKIAASGTAHARFEHSYV